MLPSPFKEPVGGALVAFGAIINLWAIQTLGIKGIYNGDSFGFLFDAPVTTGVYRYFSDPQYLGTVWSPIAAGEPHLLISRHFSYS